MKFYISKNAILINKLRKNKLEIYISIISCFSFTKIRLKYKYYK